MALGYHHWQKRKKIAVAKTGIHGANTKKLLDKFIYLAAVTSVLINLPQLITIWGDKNVSGVSLLSWLGFFVSSLFWLFYGFVHRSRSLIILNASVSIVQLFIVIGILTH